MSFLGIRFDALGRRARSRRPVLDRFWAFVDAQGEGCWLWRGYVRPNGYGSFGIDRRTLEYAHRFAYQVAVGPIGAALEVCHHCDNPRCVRPDHLFLGTRLDNMRDAKAKGRMWTGPRVSECRRGHAYTPENTAIDPRTGKRRCVACHTINGVANRDRYDRSRFDTSEYRRQTYEKHREQRLADARAYYERNRAARVAYAAQRRAARRVAA